MKAMTREEVRNVDKVAIQQWGVPGVVLMENAGRNAAEAIREFLGGDAAGKTAWIFAGAGNNGGDGYVIARHLANCGAAVRVLLACEERKIAGDARVNFEILRKLDFDIAPWSANLSAEEADVLIDALGGTGISGVLRGRLAEAADWLNAQAAPVVAIDIPTGLDCDTGEAAGPTVRAELTVTFVARKIGFDNPASEAYTGRVLVADIGVNPSV